MPRTTATAATIVSLDVIDVARPCPADWGKMKGDDRVRFCTECSLHVYNLSAMSRAEAEAMVAGREGRMCVQFFRRADGTVLTADCEGGWRLAARKIGRWAKTATAVVLSAALAPLGLTHWSSAAPTETSEDPTTVHATPPAKPASQHFLGMMAPPARQPQPAIRGEVAVPIMGDLIAPEPGPRPPSTQPSAQPSTRPAAPGATAA